MFVSLLHWDGGSHAALARMVQRPRRFPGVLAQAWPRFGGFASVLQANGRSAIAVYACMPNDEACGGSILSTFLKSPKA
jgi:hypothetical protein